MKSFLIFLSFLLFFRATAQEVIRTSVVWVQYTENLKLDDSWSAFVNIQHRNLVEREQSFHQLYGLGVTRKLNNGFSVAAGLINLNVNQFADTDFVLVPEVRPFQEMSLKVPFEKSKFDWRVRLEERFQKRAVNGAVKDDHVFTYRIRNRVQYQFPVTTGLKVLLSSEIHLNAGKYSPYPFDQHRGAAQVLFRLGSVNMSAGYLSWLVYLPSGSLDNRNGLLMSASHTVGWSK